MKKKQVGIFSGSFNPIHAGHLMLANFVHEFTYLDEVWFVVTPQNPLKDTDNLLNDNLRLEMTRIALEEYNNLNVSDIEFGMPRPSYTIDTLDKLTHENPDVEFTLVIGGDNWTRFNRWKDNERLRNEYKILIYPRLGETIEIPEEFKATIQSVRAPIIEVSSTFIRESIRLGKNVRAFVPSKVYDFIEEKKLYR